MKKNILFFLFILSFVCLKAQSPNLQWAQHIGGASSTFGQSIVIDSLGNVYTAGYFKYTTDFDPGPGIFPLTASGQWNTGVFISKLDPNGNFLWAKSIATNQNIGSLGDDEYNITLDKYGNVFLTGSFSGTTDFDPGNNIFNLTSNGNSDIFVLKLDVNGIFLWVRPVGSKAIDKAYCIASDATGNIYTGGYFKDTLDFDPGPATYTLASANASKDAFILKLDVNGDFIWVKKVDGNSDDCAISLSIDKLGNVYSTGNFSGLADFNPDPSIALLNSIGLPDTYILKMDSLGNFLWVKGFGDIGADISNSITIDETGNVFTTGYFSYSVDFDPGPGTFSLSVNPWGAQNTFILKLDPSGNFLWAKNVGGSSVSIGNSILTDSQNNSYTTGAFRFTVDFNPGPGTYTLASNGDLDIFILKLDSLGNFVWATNAGCNLDDSGNALTIDNLGNIFTCGYYRGLTDFDPAQSTYNVPLAGLHDMFITKMGQTSVGLEENNLTNNFIIYPNPTKDLINITFGNKSSDLIRFELLNLLGQIQISETSSVQPFSFPIHHLKNGIYFLKIIEQEGTVITKKIIKN